MPEVYWDVGSAPAQASLPGSQANSTAPAPTFRDTLLRSAAVWLKRGLGGKIMYTFGVHMDAFGDALVDGVKARFPGLGPPDALAVTGRERRIRRGRGESDATYAARQRRWLDDHRTRGGPYALLAQLHAHYAPDNFQIDLIYPSGRRFRLALNGDVTRDDAWTLAAEKWAHWTLFYSWPAVPSPAAVYWGDVGRTWGDGKVWGSDLTVSEVVDLRLVPREWIAGHCFGEIVLLTPDVLLWGYPTSNVWGGPGLTWGSAPAVRMAVE